MVEDAGQLSVVIVAGANDAFAAAARDGFLGSLARLSLRLLRNQDTAGYFLRG